MSEEIINRVAKSSLKIFDLEEYFPQGEFISIDIKDWLFEGLVLREKDFRQAVEQHSWEQYNNSYVSLHCSTEAIVPSWAFILIASKLEGFAKKVIKGSLEDLYSVLYLEILSSINYDAYKDERVIIKGCSRKPVPENAYLWAIEKLQPIAKSIMFGEACSAVPIFKKRKL